MKRPGYKMSLTALPAVSLFSLPFLQPGRGGNQADVLAERANRVFGRLPLVMTSEKNPVTDDKVRLGKMLFFENRISVDETVSCAKCHPFSLYAADGLRKSVGNRCLQ